MGDEEFFEAEPLAPLEADVPETLEAPHALRRMQDEEGDLRGYLSDHSDISASDTEVDFNWVSNPALAFTV